MSCVETPSPFHNMDNDYNSSTKVGDNKETLHKPEYDESFRESLSGRYKCLEVPTVTTAKKIHHADKVISLEREALLQKDEKVEIFYLDDVKDLEFTRDHSMNGMYIKFDEAKNNNENVSVLTSTQKANYDSDTKDIQLQKSSDSGSEFQGEKKWLNCTNVSVEKHSKSIRWSDVIEIKDIKFTLSPTKPSISEIAGQRLHLEAMKRRNRLMSRRNIYNNKKQDPESEAQQLASLSGKKFKLEALSTKSKQNKNKACDVAKREKLTASEKFGRSLHSKGTKTQMRLKSLREKHTLAETKDTTTNTNDEHVINQTNLSPSEKAGCALYAEAIKSRKRLALLKKKHLRNRQHKLHSKANQSSLLLSRKQDSRDDDDNGRGDDNDRGDDASISEKAAIRLYLEATERKKRLASLRYKALMNKSKSYFESAARSSILLSRKHVNHNPNMEGEPSISEKAGARLYLEATKTRKKLDSIRNKSIQGRPKLYMEAAAKSSLLLSKKYSNSKRNATATETMYEEAANKGIRLASLKKKANTNHKKLHFDDDTQPSSSKASIHNRLTPDALHGKEINPQKSPPSPQKKHHMPRPKAQPKDASKSSILFHKKTNSEPGLSIAEALYAEATARKERLASLKKKHNTPRPKLMMEAALYSSRLLSNASDRETTPCYIRLYQMARCHKRKESSVYRLKTNGTICLTARSQ